MKRLVSGVWINLYEGAAVHCSMHGSDAAYVTFSDGNSSSVDYELNFDFETFNDFVSKAVDVLAEMDELAEKEAAEAERDERKKAKPDPPSTDDQQGEPRG